MKKRCIVIIVGFDEDRDGLNENVNDIVGTFSLLFDAEFETLLNKSKDDITEVYKKFDTDEWLVKFRAVDFVTVFCLAHGQADGRIVLAGKNEVSDARRLLLNPLFKIEELDAKLKWLVVQACRGYMNDYRPMQRDGVAKIFPDIHFISYCTGEATISFQKGKGGKIYIQSLCEELRKNVHQESLCEMLKNVCTVVEEFGKTQKVETFSKPNFKKNCIDFNFYDAPQQ